MDVNSKTGDKDWISILLALSFAGSEETSCHGVNFPMERHTWQETEGYLQPAASKKLKPFVQLPMRKLIQ